MVVTLGPYQSHSRILYRVTRFDQSGSRTVTHPGTEFWNHTGLCHARGQNDVILSRSHAVTQIEIISFNLLLEEVRACAMNY